jgi:uncharacterized membrane protein YfcA
MTDEAPADLNVWKIAAVGTLAGFTSGLFGVGGGIVIVPALVLLVGFGQKLATGTSLAAIIPISISGIIGYAADDEVDFTAAAFVAGGAVLGAIVGTAWLRRIRTPVLQLVFAGVMALTAVRMLFDDPEAAGRGDLTVLAASGLVLLGVASGVLAGLLGVGGGIIIVPALTIFFGIPHVLAKGTSLAVILPTAISGTIRNRRSGLTSIRAALIVGTAGVVTAFAASRLSLGLDPKVSQALFAALLAFAAVHVARTGYRDLRRGSR